MKTARQLAHEACSNIHQNPVTLDAVDLVSLIEGAVREDRAQRVQKRRKSAEYDADGYPYVSEQEQSVATRWEHLLTNTGGNSPRELMNDLGKPNSNMMATNIVRFVLAVSVQGQVELLIRLEAEGVL